MRNECNIIRDMLPLYAENMASPDTVEFVEAHLENCDACRKEYAKIKEPETIQPKMETAPLLSLKKKMKKKKIQTVVFTVILVAALLVSAFAFLSAPEFFPYSDGLISVTENSDESITISFDEKVTDYCLETYADPEPMEKGTCSYKIEAWTSLWNRWFSNHGTLSTTIRPEESRSISVYYVQNNYEEDVCIYGQSDCAGVQTLPRLALGYYLILAGIGFAVLFIAWFIFRRKESIRIWIERLILYPIAYAVGHFVVLGFKTISYSMQRDFWLIIFLSVLFYCGLLLVRSIYKLRKELKETENS